MSRTVVLLIGFVGGLMLAGLGVGLLVPLLPETWRSEGVVWASSATLVALCVGVAFLASRPARE